MQGYERGKGRSFTPSMYCKWIEVFNDQLNDMERRGLKVSRNSLTEDLIEDGLRYRNILQDNKISVQIPSIGLTPEEIQLIQSEHGQLILKNLLMAMLGKGGSPWTIPSPVSRSISETSIASTELEIHTSDTDNTKENDEKSEVLGIEETKSRKIPAQGMKISAKEKAMQRLSKINI